MAAGSMAESFSHDTTPELEAAQQLEEAGRFLDLEKWILQRLRYGERETQLHLQVTNDSGEPRIVRATRAQHSSVRGPGMGPLVFSKHLSTADINALAMNLSWQWALWKLPFSGAAGVIGAEVEELSEREARLLTRCYVGQLQGTIGPQLDVITPARGSHPEIMAWALSALGTADGRTLATITGKPISIGGVDTNLVAARFFRALFACVMKQYGIPSKGARAAVLGFDPLARRMALELDRTGTRVIAAADRSGGVYDSSGLDVASLVHHVEKEAIIYGFPDAQAISVDELLEHECDALILCGPEPLLQQTSARTIFEAGGLVRSALSPRRIVIPTLLADFGLSFAAFCEWRKNSSGGFSDVDGLRGLPVHVRNTWREVHDYANGHNLDLQRASLALAVSRVAEAMRMR